MVETLIKDWLSEIATLEYNDWATFAITTSQNKTLIESLYAVFDDIQKYSKLVDRVCGALFNCYRTEETDLHLFVLLFLPHLTYSYLNSVAHIDKQSCRSIEALLIGIYNLEVVDENNTPRSLSFRLPSLAQPSIYHEPSSLAPTSLTEIAIRRLEQRDTHPVRRGPFNQIERLSASNRMEVLSNLYFIYYKNINLLSDVYNPFDRFYRVTSKMVTQGFHHKRLSSFSKLDVSSSTKHLPRIPLSPKFLIHLLYCLYVSIFNYGKAEALQTLEDIYHRACYSCYCEVILLANAIKNSCRGYFEGGCSPNVSSVGTPVSNNSSSTQVSKSMITNASFRTKKLPDDIPIQNNQKMLDESFDAGTNLSSITEETDNKDANADLAPVKRSLPQIAANFGKKTAEKIATAVKSTANTKVSKLSNQNGSDIYETDESGIDLAGSDISDTKTGVSHEERTTMTPLLNRRNPSMTVDMESARSIQMESTTF